jgi:hypothetical protein
MEMDNAAVDNNEIDDDGIKIVEIHPQFISSSHCADGSDTGSESDSGSGSGSDSESESGSENENMIQDIHVIKIDSGDSGPGQEKDAPGSEQEKEKKKEKETEKEKGTQKKTLVLDLEKEEVSAPSASTQYSSLSIKQLRQLVKKKSILLDSENEISKMKREQLIELLSSSSNKQ